MPVIVIVVGMISMPVSPQIGIFAIVLGVMLWTSVKSRQTARKAQEKTCAVDSVDRVPAATRDRRTEGAAERSTRK